MAVRTIRIWPDPALSQKAVPVAEVTQETRALVADLFDTMYAESGIGLASNQIGVALRVLVIDLDPRKQGADDPDVQAELEDWGYAGPQAFINPQIMESSKETLVWEEGCLSVPGVTNNVTRKARVVVKALDTQGQPFTMALEGLYSVALQHELDHLNGRVFVEYLSRLKRDGIKRKMLRLKAHEADTADDAAADQR